MCERCSKWKHARKLIFVADPDDEKIKKILGKEEEPCYINWGNNVFSFVSPLPPHREETPSICIEHYYTDEEIKTPVEINGIKRRLYMGNEFDDDGIAIDANINCTDQKSCGESSIKIIDGSNNRNVHIMRDKKKPKTNLALSKMSFAENILNKVEGFDQMNFDNFQLIFNLVKKILSEPLV